MAILGDAAVAMWWNVADEHRTEFHEWHSKEHLPERLGIPGFHRGSRWQREGSGDFFVMYELEDYDTLTSESYLVRLNNPTPWSTKMMPLHSGMVRSQCRIVESRGGGIASHMLTARLSPEKGKERDLKDWLTGVVAGLPDRAAVTNAHFLRTETPTSAQTKEQKIRGGDAVADWIVLISGHDPAALEAAGAEALDVEALTSNGAAGAPVSALYRLVHALTSLDV